MRVKLFAVCRERAGKDELVVHLPDGARTLNDLRGAVAEACPELAPLLPFLRVGINHEFAAEDVEILATDEIALIPPVSGGAGAFALTRSELHIQQITPLVESSAAGAVATFMGTVREANQGHKVLALEYEAYEPMALRYLEKIGQEVVVANEGMQVAIHHRLGHLKVGEVAVVIAVSSPHRDAAFSGCRHLIERLKQDVPIWKKEFRQDGTVWIGVGS